MNILPPTTKNLCAVIVTYHPDNGFPDRLNILFNQMEHAVIVDNHSDQKSRETLNDLMTQGQAQVIFNQDNLGIAAALNQGIRWAKKQGFQWVLTLDQDSYLEESAIDTFIKTYNGLETPEKVAIVGLNHIDTNSRQQYYRSSCAAGRGWVERKTLITSGSFMPIHIFDDLGPFQEELFIDGVDHEYCLRARRKGYKNILILNPLLKHAMGNRTSTPLPLFPGIKLVNTNYPPFRRYFMTRNRLIVCREYLVSDTIWSIMSFARLIGSLLLMLSCENNRIHKLKFAALGFKNGLRRNMKRKIIFPPVTKL